MHMYILVHQNHTSIKRLVYTWYHTLHLLLDMWNSGSQSSIQLSFINNISLCSWKSSLLFFASKQVDHLIHWFSVVQWLWWSLLFCCRSITTQVCLAYIKAHVHLSTITHWRGLASADDPVPYVTNLEYVVSVWNVVPYVESLHQSPYPGLQYSTCAHAWTE